MNPTYALFVDLSGRRVVVVGAGQVATRRLKDLIEAKAAIEVISPEATAEIQNLNQDGVVKWVSRNFHADDLLGAWLVITATGAEEVDRTVALEANTRGIFCIVMSDASLASAWRPAVAKGSDGVSISVNGGGDPRRAMAIRNAISLQLDSGQLPLRPKRSSGKIGTVHLVGGGPGVVGLLTLRARYLLSIADVVVVDKLAPRAILAEISDEVEIIDGGKSPGDHKLTQLEINKLIVERALAGQRVIRLKGGDPFVLGRGSEEMQACLAAGIKCEVVPGISSAISVPAAAGIPLTHRGLSQSFTVENGHSEIPLVLEDKRKSYVILMGIENLENIISQFNFQDWPSTTQVAVIERGWSSEQRTTIGTLENIVALKESIGFESPAVIVVGEVVKFHEEFGNQHEFSI